MHQLEESARVPLSEDAYDTGSDHSSQSRAASPVELSDVPINASSLSPLCEVCGESTLVWLSGGGEFDVDEKSELVLRER